MDTRRLPASNEAVQWPSSEVLAGEVEIVELRHVERPIRGLVGKLAFVVMVATLAGLIAIAGMPSRTSFALDNPLPNLFAPVTAP